MKGTSKVIMGATLVMVVSLAVVLGLILVLLAELYCSLLLRRRRLRNNNHPNNSTIPTTTTAPTTIRATPSSYSPNSHHHAPHSPPPPPPQLNNSVYSQGVLQAPRSFLFPSVTESEPNANANANANGSPIRIGLVSVPSPLASFINRAPPIPMQDPLQHGGSSSVGDEKHDLVYISNPIYENEDGKGSDGAIINIATPFETPDTSPSRLEKSGASSSSSSSSSCGDDGVGVQEFCDSYTPPLTPMKKLPAEANCSVSLRDARSLATSCSDSRSNRGVSSSSSASPCTSPSW